VTAYSAAQVEKVFGAEIAAAVTHEATGTWIGPLPSPYGLHLVWVEAREPGTPPPLAAVRDRLVERWQDEQRTLRIGALLQELARRYPLEVESAAWRERRAS
jgi:parvulin-like peptidyl-prolyl isomerase